MEKNHYSIIAQGTTFTGNYSQYLVITYNGKQSEKIYICV